MNGTERRLFIVKTQSIGILRTNTKNAMRNIQLKECIIDHLVVE